MKYFNDCKPTFSSPHARRAWWVVRLLMTAVLRWAVGVLLEVDD